jgi:hypothetical protein
VGGCNDSADGEPSQLPAAVEECYSLGNSFISLWTYDSYGVLLNSVSLSGVLFGDLLRTAHLLAIPSFTYNRVLNHGAPPFAWVCIHLHDLALLCTCPSFCRVLRFKRGTWQHVKKRVLAKIQV